MEVIIIIEYCLGAVFLLMGISYFIQDRIIRHFFSKYTKLLEHAKSENGGVPEGFFEFFESAFTSLTAIVSKRKNVALLSLYTDYIETIERTIHFCSHDVNLVIKLFKKMDYPYNIKRLWANCPPGSYRDMLERLYYSPFYRTSFSVSMWARSNAEINFPSEYSQEYLDDLIRNYSTLRKLSEILCTVPKIETCFSLDIMDRRMSNYLKESIKAPNITLSQLLYMLKILSYHECHLSRNVIEFEISKINTLPMNQLKGMVTV